MREYPPRGGRSRPAAIDPADFIADERARLLLLNAEQHAERWVASPARAPAFFMDVPLWVFNDRLLRTVHPRREGGKAPLLIAAPNGLGLLWHRRRFVWPRILCARLRSDILNAVVRSAWDTFRAATERSADHSTVEIAGDILCANGTRTATHWEVDCVPCFDRRATHVSSAPSCNGGRRCDNPDPRRKRGYLVGEWHSHPQHNPRHIKPLSDYDLYQLVLSTANGYHSCSVVLSHEGVYVCVASGLTLLRFVPEVFAYYRLNGMDAKRCRDSMRRCRQPVAENVPDSLPVLYWLFRRLRQQYTELMQRSDVQGQTHADLVDAFFRLLEPYGFHGIYHPWQKDPRNWRLPSDARLAPVATAMLAPLPPMPVWTDAAAASP